MNSPEMATSFRQSGTIRKLDAIDGSPVLDIKRYVSESYPREGIRIPAWMQQIQNDIGRAGR
jgi:tRNA (Thr-GGU) A37 N-methylase